MSKVNIAVFASGKGTNFTALLKAAKSRLIKADIKLLVCDNPQAPVLGRARRAGIGIALVKKADFLTKVEFEQEIIRHLKKNDIGLIVLAGFMRVLGPDLINAYKDKILNIHPALLPAFKGAHAIRDAFDYGAKITGVTVHFVDEKMDHGPIILQQAVKIEDLDTLESLETKIHKMEHKIYPQAVRLFIEDRLKIEGRKLIIR